MPRNKGFSLSTKRLSAELKTFNPRVNSAITAAFEYQAPKSEARMKTNASWTDRTTNARSGLFTKPMHEGNHHELLLSHLVAYGIFLELRFSGRYAIVIPEIIRAGEDIKRLLNKLLRTLPKG